MQALQDGTVASSQVAQGFVGVDARRRRFAINPGGYLWFMDSRETGRTEPILPPGLLTFRTTQMSEENYEDVLRVPEGEFQKQIIKEFPAKYFLDNVITRYGPQGCRELTSITLLNDPEPNEKGNITKEQVAKSAQGYFAAVYPSFAEIGHACPEELTDCATCRLQLLESAEVGERISKLPDPSIGEKLRLECIAANQTYHDFCDQRWGELIGEMKNRKDGEPGINKLDASGHHVRKHLHAIEPTEAATAASYGEKVAVSQSEGFKELAAAMRESGGGDNSKVLEMILERQAKQDEILAKLAEKVK